MQTIKVVKDDIIKNQEKALRKSLYLKTSEISTIIWGLFHNMGIVTEKQYPLTSSTWISQKYGTDNHFCPMIWLVRPVLSFSNFKKLKKYIRKSFFFGVGRIQSCSYLFQADNQVLSSIFAQQSHKLTADCLHIL